MRGFDMVNPKIEFTGSDVVKMMELAELGSVYAKVQLDNLGMRKTKQKPRAEIIKLHDQSEVIEKRIMILLNQTVAYLHGMRTLKSLLLIMKSYILCRSEPTVNKSGLDSNGYTRIKKIVENYGLTVHTGTKELAIIHNNAAIINILNISKWYNGLFSMHKDVILKSTCMNIQDKTKRVTVITGFLF